MVTTPGREDVISKRVNRLARLVQEGRELNDTFQWYRGGLASVHVTDYRLLDNNLVSIATKRPLCMEKKHIKAEREHIVNEAAVLHTLLAAHSQGRWSCAQCLAHPFMHAMLQRSGNLVRSKHAPLHPYIDPQRHLPYPFPIPIQSPNEGNNHTLTMEGIPGISLQTALAPLREESWKMRFRIMAYCAQVLCDIRRVFGLTHCDFKPGNLMLGQDGYPRAIDFGSAQIIPTPAQICGQQPIVTPSTFSFMAPEQFKREPVQESDMFALGNVLHALLDPVGNSATQHVARERDEFLTVVLGNNSTKLNCMNHINMSHAGLKALLPLVQKTLNRDPHQRGTPEEILRICRRLSSGIRPRNIAAFVRNLKPDNTCLPSDVIEPDNQISSLHLHEYSGEVLDG